MSYKLFLDDFRQPIDCVQYMHQRIGAKNPIYLETGWKVAVNYDHFIRCIKRNGLPSFVSFDHDLSMEHYDGATPVGGYKEKTGLDCARWLIGYCIDNAAPFPDYAVHSMNPVGADNIKSCIENFRKAQ